MKNLKNRRGISLIVLVITIIVMLILATAIILSLNNSGIIGKANKAKNDSDTATLKEYVNTLKLDWEFMTAEEKTAAGSFSEYATSKLEEKGYNRMVTEDGVILTEGATAAVKAGIEIGDEVTGYNNYITLESTQTDGNENNLADNYQETYGDYVDGEAQVQTIYSKKFTKWRYVGLSDNGEIMIAPDMTDSNIPKMKLSGTGGYYNGPNALDKACKELYTTSKGTARSMNIDDVNKILEYTGPKGGYYYYDFDGDSSMFGWRTLPEPLSITEVRSLGMTVLPCFWSGIAPNIEDIPCDYYTIENNSQNTDINQSRTSLIYYSNTYWLASSTYDYDTSYVRALVRCVSSSPSRVEATSMFYSATAFPGAELAIRPIVTLNPEVILENPSDGVWSIN